MTLSFLWSAITDSVKKTMRAWRLVVAVVLLSLVIVAGCDVRPFSEFSGDDNGSENGNDTGSEGTSGDDTNGDGDNEPDDTLTVTPTTLTTSVGIERTIDLNVVDPDPERTYTFDITDNPDNGEAGIDEFDDDTGRLTYEPDTGFTGPDRLVVRVRDDGTTQRSGMITIQITVTQN